MPEQLEGTIERITYQSEETGYTIARFLGSDGVERTIVGHLPGLSAGEPVRLKGDWTTHPQFGRQFKVESYATILPITCEGIQKYLGSGLMRGIGPATARQLVDHFGLDTLRVIEEEPSRLGAAPGIGPRRIEMIRAAWVEQKKVKEVMLFLQSHDVSVSLATKLYKHYGDATVDVVRQNPYRLAREVFGIGFVTADRIAQQLGLPADAPARAQAGLLFVLGQMADEGHVYAPAGEMLSRASELLHVQPAVLQTALDVLERERSVRREPLSAGEAAVYLWPFYVAELGVAERLRTLAHWSLSALPFSTEEDWPALLDRAADDSRLALNGEQREAVRRALTHKVSVLTGGPGTGKTTAVRTILGLLAQRNCRCALTAPTGRAAKRLSELTGQEAKTIHRLLEFSPQAGNRFQRDENHLLEADVVIVDEASMLDTLLAYHLVKAVPPSAHLVLVGDVDQLPAVGAGSVLQDLIASQLVPVTRLQQIFRQSSTSWIVENAHRVRQGQSPYFSSDAADFFLFPAEEPERAAELLVEVVQTRIPRKFGLDPLSDIQVLCPMHRGPAGVQSLNERLQAALNPARPGRAERSFSGQLLRVGDRVMQTRNNYEKEVFNGDIGVVLELDLENQGLTALFDERRVSYDFSEADELTLAYATSVHKSQGSEYPAVVIPLLTQQYMMLQRNLLYTAITRARRLVVLVGSGRAVDLAVRNARMVQRHTGLCPRLQGKEIGEGGLSPATPAGR